MVEVGGSSTIEQSLEATKRGGVISLVGFLTESKAMDLIPSVIFGAKICKFSSLLPRMRLIDDSERCLWIHQGA